MVKSEKAVAVAHDILQQIKARKYKPLSGAYINNVDVKSSFTQFELSVQKSLAHVKKCEVCAIGACILSAINLFNGITTANLDLYKASNRRGLGDPNLTKLLTSIFNKKDLQLIEYFFESTLTGDRYAEDVLDLSYKNNEIKISKAIIEGNKFKSDKAKLIFVCENIIQNKGRFIL